MNVWNGHFDSKGNPCLSIEVSGDGPSPLVVSAIIDTGFSGFLMMPVFQAMPLGMPSLGSTTANLADGNKIAAMMMFGRVKFAGRTEMGPVLLPGNNQLVLVGLDFLRKFKLALVITSQAIALMDEDDMRALAANSPARLRDQGPPAYDD